MPEVDYSHVINCVSDTVTQVRDYAGNLVGCIPKIDENQPLPYLTGRNGEAFSIGVFSMMCIEVKPGQDASQLNGFVGNPTYRAPRIERNPLAEPMEGVDVQHPGHNPDLAKDV